MKKQVTVSALLAVILVIAARSEAAPPRAIDSYFTNAVIVTTANTNSGTTGLATETTYVAFKVDESTNASYTLAMVTNDVRPFLANMLRYMQAQIAAQDSTNQFSTFSIREDTQWDSATNRTIYRMLSEGQTFTITPTYGD